MAQNGVNIPIRTDTSQAEKGIDKLTGKFNNLKRQLDGNDPLKRLNDSYNDLTSAISSSGLGMVISKEIDILKSEFEWIEKTADAYRIQLRAETQLSQAARNNPYLNSESVENLKSFASAVQGYSEYGDEFLMPFMAQLATAGRNEEEIMKIISVSADIAASGTMDFASAVTNLNKSLTGSIGKMSAGDIELKNLTKEELENGKAIEVLGQKYGGMAQEVALATGAVTQLGNSAGDLQESFGKITKPFSDMMANIKNDLTNFVINELDPFFEKLRYSASFTGGTKDLEKSVEWINKVNKEKESLVYNDQISLKLLQDQEKYFKDYLKYNEKLTDEQNDAYTILKDAIRLKTREEEFKKKELAKAKELATIRESNLKSNKEELELTESKLEKQKMLADTEKANYDEIEEKLKDLEKEAEGTRDLMKGLSPDTAEYVTLRNQLQAINEEMDGLYKTQSSLTSENSRLIDLQEKEKILVDEIAQKRKNMLSDFYAQIKKAESDINNTRLSGGSVTNAEASKKIVDDAKKNLKQMLEAGLDITSSEYKAAVKEIAKLTEREQNAKAEDLKKQYRQTIKQFEDNWKAQNELNKKANREEATDIEYKRAKFEKMKTAYFSMLNSSAGLISTNNSLSKEIKTELSKLAIEIDAYDSILRFDDFSQQIEEYGLTEIERQKNELLTLRAAFQSILNNGENTPEQIDLLKKAINGVNEALNELNNLELDPKGLKEWQKALIKEMNKVLDKLSQVQNFINNFSSTVSELSTIAQNNAEAEATIELAKEQEKYDKGLISYDNYMKQKEKIEKNAEKRKYKAQMWEWTASLLQIGTNTAQAMVGAIAKDPTPVGVALATTFGILGGAQLAAAIANKPIPPSYAGGGFIGGMQGVLSGGDDSIATVKRGEMILNGTQQRNLLNLLSNGNNNGMNVNIKNYMGGQADVKTQLTADGLSVIIKQQIQNEFNNGNLDGAILSSQNRQGGVLYTS